MQREALHKSLVIDDRNKNNNVSEHEEERNKRINKLIDEIEHRRKELKVETLSFNSFYEFSVQRIPDICNENSITGIDISTYRYMMKDFYRGGNHDKTLNENMDSSLFDETFIVFEIDSIKDDPLLFPLVPLIIMDVFLQKMRVKKNRKVLVIEEAWKAIASPLMAEYIKFLYKTARKFWASVGVVTQEIQDIIGSEIVKEAIINNLAAASETAETLLKSLQKGKKEGGGGSDQFFQTSAVNFLAACIYFFCNWEKEPYDKDGNKLIAEVMEDKQTKRMIQTGKVFNTVGELVEPAYWLGKYSDMPHILSFLDESYQTIFEVLETDNEVAPLLGPFQTAFKNKAMEQLEGMIVTLRVYTSRLATKESYWIFHKDGDDFDLKVSDPNNPSYLLIANDPEMESIIGALNALILNRLVTRVNTGQGKNIPVSIIVDELPTLYFHKIDRLIGTARSNKVSVALGFQELPQLEADYGKVGMQKIITTVGNVVSGSARSKETLEWLSNDIFGKVVQLKKGVTIDRDKTSINLNENMDSLVPASKISDMPTGWICGQSARDFIATKTGVGGSMNIQESEEFQTSKFYCKTNFDMDEIKKEEAGYVALPKFYTFKSREERERILYKNFIQVGEDVKQMIDIIFARKRAK